MPKKLGKIYVLGNDPAPNNYGFCLASFKNDGTYKVITCGVLKNTLQDLKQDVRDQLYVFLDELSSIKKYDKVTHLVIERYLNRGKFGGTTNETVNQMIGALVLGSEQNVEVIEITSSMWKNSCNRHFVLDTVKEKGPKLKKGEVSLYKEANKSKVPNHVIDGFLQAAYTADKILGNNTYKKLGNSKERTALVRRLKNGMSVNES